MTMPGHAPEIAIPIPKIDEPITPKVPVKASIFFKFVFEVFEGIVRCLEPLRRVLHRKMRPLLRLRRLWGIRD